MDYNVRALLPLVHDTFTSKNNISLTLDVPAADKRTDFVLTELAEQLDRPHSEKSATFRESNHGSGVCKEHNVPKSSILLAGTGV